MLTENFLPRADIMPNIFATYQSRLRIFFFQGSIYFLLFTIILTVTRILFVGDWQSVVKVITYCFVTLLLTWILRTLRKETAAITARTPVEPLLGRIDPVPTNTVAPSLPELSGPLLRAQTVGVVVLQITAAIYIAVTPHALFVLGVIMLATILFFSVLSAAKQQARQWLGLTILLFLTALTCRQLVPALRIDYSFDLLLTLYLFPPFFFWLCAKIATNLLNQLVELLAVGQGLEADLRQSELQYQQLLQTMN
ncbi:MAG: hypothetical protein KDE53_31575, partial [Caldilineaceae bacterium]|nr:hypothetical protein [Caldilineaceae bacterium]